ncbi:tetratricopeptide repeat-containing diguanylate cyclase [Athalassotoga sp.]|uniref:tetratricopeptide repeat-containing diguanylate cyclase n=1 Tax=Athalassotoga sp. TaxID=2022597 RepID=UPI003D003F65
MGILKIKDTPYYRDLLPKLSFCSIFPKIEGFKFCDRCLELSFEDLSERPIHITENEFLRFVKELYHCYSNDIPVGIIEKENVFVKKGKIVVIPSFKDEISVVNGRIENPLSFFTSIRTFAHAFKGSSPFLMKIFKEGLPAIIDLMEHLGLEIQPKSAFLPSLGVWRHDVFVEKINSEKGLVEIPIDDGGIFSKFLKGEVFSSLEEIKGHIENSRYKIDPDNADPSALSFLFNANEGKKYIFNCGKSVEMVTFVKFLHKFRPDLDIIAIHDPAFEFEDGKRIEFPVISKKEFNWFLNTFFNYDFEFEGDLDLLFEITGGENFAISKSIRDGEWNFNGGKWHIKPKLSRSSPVSYLINARKLARTGSKPYLGLELVNAASKVSDKNLESFESLRAFFHKVLGEYEFMLNDLKRADAFGRRNFRNAYFSIVLAMNGFNPVIEENEASDLVRICRTYARIVKDGNIGKIYDEVIHPIENIKGREARRIEVMARNYAGIIHLQKEEYEEAIDALETALSMAREEDFKDLIPLVEMNVGYAFLNMSPNTAKERLEVALSESIEEGLWKTFQIANLTMAQNLIEMGNFDMAKESLETIRAVGDEWEKDIEYLNSRMHVENIEDIDLKDADLKFMRFIYTDDEKNAIALLKSGGVTDGKYLLEIAQNPVKAIETISLPKNPYVIYFISKLRSFRAIRVMRRYGEKLYRDGFFTRSIFYEEQLAKLYRQMGWKNSANVHLKIAANMAESIGLQKRAEFINAKIDGDVSDLLKITGFCFYSINLDSVKAVMESLTSELFKYLKKRILCRMTGVENIGYVCEDGHAYQIEEEITLAPWVLDDKKFVYDFPVRSGEILIEIDRSSLDLDKAVSILDSLVPIYKLKFERVIASKLSDFDQLTNVYTRRYIFERLYEEVERSRRYKEFLSVAMIDIDDFKRVNDTYGHDVGDEVLKKIADTLKSSVRKIDIIGRYGGEEFLILFPHTQLDQSIKSAQRILKSVRENFKWMKLTLSIGMAEMNSSCDNVEKLVKCADIALYRAKAAGKNRISKYTESEV